MKQNIALSNGIMMPRLGMGTWFLGENKKTRKEEIEALRAGLDAGVMLIDTAEMYGEGLSEELIGEAIKGYDRSKLFLISKVYPQNAGSRRIFHSVQQSLKRLGIDYLDLYLLHWRGGIPLEETVACMEQLVREGKIKNWGVSNFDTDDMEELWSIPGGEHCAVNEVLYHLGSRGVEYDLLPWLRIHGVAMIAYCPLAQAGELQHALLSDLIIQNIAAAHNTSPIEILLAFVLHQEGVCAIPRSGKKEHVLQNIKGAEIVLSDEEIALISKRFPAPDHKIYLDIV